MVVARWPDCYAAAVLRRKRWALKLKGLRLGDSFAQVALISPVRSRRCWLPLRGRRTAAPGSWPIRQSLMVDGPDNE